MALFDNANSPILERNCSQLYDLNIRYRYLATGGTNYKKRDAAEHEEILDVAMLGNYGAAATVLIGY